MVLNNNLVTLLRDLFLYCRDKLYYHTDILMNKLNVLNHRQMYQEVLIIKLTEFTTTLTMRDEK